MKRHCLRVLIAAPLLVGACAPAKPFDICTAKDGLHRNVTVDFEWSTDLIGWSNYKSPACHDVNVAVFDGRLEDSLQRSLYDAAYRDLVRSPDHTVKMTVTMRGDFLYRSKDGYRSFDPKSVEFKE